MTKVSAKCWYNIQNHENLGNLKLETTSAFNWMGFIC